ncbi:MAG: TonB-dependent receptor [Deltaproteobacteria bacterium]|nr:TonB-dependent receptor [Deltaproteobacteria bacterium]
MKLFRSGWFFKALLPICLFLLVSSVSSAADKGRVSGQVRDSLNDIYLMGVLVSSADGGNKTVTDRNGKYSLVLPVGPQELNFSYLGYEPISRSVAVAAEAVSSLDVDFSQTSVQLGEVVIKGQAVGQARALNQQKNAPNIKNIVASDAMGRFPDQNAAEALGRIPGVSVERDQGEGRFVIIRGIDPHLNSASVDGISLSSAEAGTRAVLLDVIPMNVMESLVVTKALTADMPADSIGGHVDIVTPSAYDRSEMTLHGSIGGNYFDLTDQAAETGRFTFGDVFGDRQQFGFLASVGYDKRDLGSDNVEADPWEKDDNGNWVTEELQYREYDLTRERFGFTTNLEFRPSDDHHFFLRGLASSFTDHEYRRRAIIGDMMMLPAGSGNGSIVGEDYEDDQAELYPETAIELKDREETQSNWAVSLGGAHKFNRWTFDYKLAYSYAEQDTPFDVQFAYENEDLRYDYSDAAGDTPEVQVSEGDLNDLEGYELDKVEKSKQIVEEEAWILTANLKKDLDAGFLKSVKTGVHLTLRNKTNDLETTVYEDAPEVYSTLAGYTGDGRDEFSRFPLVDKNMKSIFSRYQDQFGEVERSLEDSVVEDYETDEDVYAAYLMGEAAWGRLSLTPGVRVEYTDLDARGNAFDEETEVVGKQSKTNSYTNFLPSLHAKYGFTDDLILYLAWTNTLSRPQWEQTFYGKFIDDDGNIEIGNPDLDPYEAMNWDATLSYFSPKSLGMASIGVFYKDIDNFIYGQTADMGDYELTTFKNGDSGHIYGLELAAQLKLSFLPAPFDGFSLDGNITFSDSEAEVLAPEAGDKNRDIDFVRHSDTVGSFAISYEKYNLFVRLSGTFRSSYLDELGEESFEDRYIDDHFQLDLSTSYTFMEKFTLYANFINLTNEPLKAYFGDSGRLSQFEEYGWSAQAGLKFNF